jgi:predicted phage terminase large subunit-like protein
VINKTVRIRTLNTYIAQRKLRFKNRSPGTERLVNQLRDFPNGDHDDGPDALEMAIRVMGQILQGHAEFQARLRQQAAPPRLYRG